MSEEPLPSADEAYRSLLTKGDWFAESPLRPVPLGIEYAHPGGTIQLEADMRVLDVIKRLFVDDPKLSRRLELNGNVVEPIATAFDNITRFLHTDRLVWGVSGFASPGEPYADEAKFMRLLYEFLQAKDEFRPSLITDGGGGFGVPGLNAFLAPEYGFRTLRFSPYSALPLLAPGFWTVIHGPDFEHRLKLVGLTPDILVCFNGGKGALAECVASVEHGGIVLLVILKDAGPKSLGATWYQDNDLVTAAARGQLLVCSRVHEVHEAVRWCVAQAWSIATERRPERLAAIAKEFGLSPQQD